MTWEAWPTALTIAAVFYFLIRDLATDIVLVAAVTMLTAIGQVMDSPRLPNIGDAVAGLGNEGLVTVAVLFIVVTGLVETGAMSLVAGPIVGHPKSVFSAQVRLLTPAGHVAQCFLEQYASRRHVPADRF